MSAGAQDVPWTLNSHPEAVRNGTYLSLAALALLLYDYLLTFSEEIEYFWSAPWSTSRVLFFINRYLAPVVQILSILCKFSATCKIEIAAMLIQFCRLPWSTIRNTIIVLRVWYIYSRRRLARLAVVGSFLACTAVTLSELGLVGLQLLNMTKTVACTIEMLYKVWRMYVPVLALHTVLFVATTWPALQKHRQGQSAPILFRLVRDGGMFYIMVFAATAWTAIGAFEDHRPAILIPALYSNAAMAVPSVCVSRLMLSIHSLAASLDVNTDALLSAAELSRMHWRPGAHAGEIFVDIDAVEVEDELALCPRTTHYGAVEMAVFRNREQ
ncbi:hypothetical protein WOLCODRAFT_76925 [Wolfiporia cocos MD-104 SS10]|uniref:DUF6533 domain-containing protein n=1 Tax=Wolfiporia cocos (strain MD-104) TaxID=742152 RepID=A0A2H3JZR7_WOLCO|nr:hypothetical protein WOLCODRAFT_76925 [Wolfiporia cocos MD-104 SS10]